MTKTAKLTKTQIKVLNHYRTGEPSGVQSNHKIAAERVLRYMGLLETDDSGEFVITEAGRAAR